MKTKTFFFNLNEIETICTLGKKKKYPQWSEKWTHEQKEKEENDREINKFKKKMQIQYDFTLRLH